MKSLKGNQGFSLVELIVVIAIMAILVGVAVPVYSGYIQKAQETKDAQYLDELSRAVQIFAAEKGIALQSVWVAPVVTDSQGILLYDSEGNLYQGDVSELYEMIGTYDFETTDTSTPIYFTPDAENDGSADTPCTQHTEKEGATVVATCMNQGYKVCSTCNRKYDFVSRTTHRTDTEQIGNMTVKRCADCDYVSVSFEGNVIGG